MLNVIAITDDAPNPIVATVAHHNRREHDMRAIQISQYDHMLFITIRVPRCISRRLKLNQRILGGRVVRRDWLHDPHITIHWGRDPLA